MSISKEIRADVCEGATRFSITLTPVGEGDMHPMAVVRALQDLAADYEGRWLKWCEKAGVEPGCEIVHIPAPEDRGGEQH